MARVTTGLKRLDGLLGGGFPERTVILVSGGPGCGKTLFGLNFLMEGARKGEKCCYVSLSETRDELLRACERISGLNDIAKYQGKNLAIEHLRLGENVTTKKFIEIIGRYPRIDRLVVDNVNKLLMFSENRKSYRIHLSELAANLKEMGCTLMLCESASDAIDSGNHEAFELDAVIHLSFLDLEEKPLRSLAVHKMRYTSFNPRVPYELLITEKGMDLADKKVI
jgi:circadian clock protein KaiC